MITKVLVANRGEIAVRIIKTLKKMGLATVAIASRVDRHAAHVILADEVVELGEGPVSDNYLCIDKVIYAMVTTGSHAVHPGYGLLSENVDFIEAVENAGLIFIGPTRDQIESFGLKDRARVLAETAGVPLVPGTDPLTSLDEALNMAEDIGYPIMLKATAGGGGIGMMRCADEKSLQEGYQSVTDLAINNFGNGAVFLEKCIDRARHIEVQVFGDGKGQVLSLGTRDCSLQRRHQKVLEETPAIDLPEGLSQSMENHAIALCQTHDYRSAGTVEFIYDIQEQKPYFLEVNTRLQVEHTVTEEVYGIDLVEWMVRLANDDLTFWPTQKLIPNGHAFEARIYAEDPIRDFQPSTGEISTFHFGGSPRIDTWVSPGTSITPYYDPLLAKIIVHGAHRDEALSKLSEALDEAEIGGVQTNARWLSTILKSEPFLKGVPSTKFIEQHVVHPPAVEVLNPGIQTTIQDAPGRIGYWDVGVPPSGPMDDWSFRLGNRLLDNAPLAAGLECLIQGPALRFTQATRVCVTGAQVTVHLNGQQVPMWKSIEVHEGSTLEVGKVISTGSRVYVCFDGGCQTPLYLGSRSTFTLGKFGGHCGRPLLMGDTLPLLGAKAHVPIREVPSCRPTMTSNWEVRVLMGPHTSPEFFTDDDLATLIKTEWKIHFNSDRTGVRLIGPQPQWAREDGGEAGLHPSNIHDNAYSIGAMDFTGDQPVLLGPDGPSLGGFVCPLTIIKADLWKMGQFSSDDTLRFVPVSYSDAQELRHSQQQALHDLSNDSLLIKDIPSESPILIQTNTEPKILIRQSGDGAILCEFGDLKLDIDLRIHVHFLMEHMLEYKGDLFSECTPGIRSIQFKLVERPSLRDELMQKIIEVHERVLQQPPTKFKSRIIHLPLSWNDPSTQLAIEKYVTNVRPDAPWCCPNNIEFIRRANGLNSQQEVKDIIYHASYLVMGLGDVYLGAPVAVPLDPRHRLVTTKYNPARTWTPENAVGIGGAYMCIYGMEGPGGYQFVGRTLPVWNRFKKSEHFQEPYLLRFFDQIRFYEVSPEELLDQREAFLADRHHIKIEETEFDIDQYHQFLDSIQEESSTFKQQQTQAFEEEKQRWRESGQFSFNADTSLTAQDEHSVPPGAMPIHATVSGSVWKCLVAAGDKVEEHQSLLILESMKMEIPLTATSSGIIEKLFVTPGQTLQAGQCCGYLKI